MATTHFLMDLVFIITCLSAIIVSLTWGISQTLINSIEIQEFDESPLAEFEGFIIMMGLILTLASSVVLAFEIAKWLFQSITRN